MKSNNSELSLANINNMYTPEVLLAMAEIQQARSNYQIEKFVINQHDTPQTQYQQCLIELQMIDIALKPPFCQTDVTSSDCRNLDLFGNDVIDKKNLSDWFILQPFSVLIVESDVWQTRKKIWRNRLKETEKAKLMHVTQSMHLSQPWPAQCCRAKAIGEEKKRKKKKIWRKNEPASEG